MGVNVVKQLRASYRMVILILIMGSLFGTSLLIVLFAKASILRSFYKIHMEGEIAKNMQQHFRLLLRLMNVKWQVSEDLQEPIISKGSLFLSNHISYLDIILLSAAYPMAFVAKKEVSTWLGLGTLVRMMNTIFVVRDSIASRVQCIRSLQRNIKSTNYCVFPEGTTTLSKVPKIKNWKAGNLFVAKISKTRVIATSVCYQDHNDLYWIDDMTLLPHLWKLLQKKRIVAGIQLKEFRSRDLLTDNIRKTARKVCSEVSYLCQDTEFLFAQPLKMIPTWELSK